MPLAIIQTANRTGPVIICDVCGERIDNARMANFMWNQHELIDGEPSTDFLIVHKIKCTQVADAMKDTRLATTGLGLALYQLTANVGLSIADLEDLADTQTRIEGLE